MLTATEFRQLCISLVGLPYVLGTEAKVGVKPKALDCSELVEWVYGTNGTPIGDLAAAQYDKCVAVTNPKVGDLVFLRNNPARWNKIGHVAVITSRLSSGDWEIVEARGHASGVVRTDLSYWRRRTTFAGVRRFPGFKLASTTTTGSTTTSVTPAWLVVDGDFGPKTTKALQWSLGLPQTGQFDLATRKALQRRLGVKDDGIIGPITTKALQHRVHATADACWGPQTTRRVQRRLNEAISSRKPADF